jgi:hypothetical protein
MQAFKSAFQAFKASFEGHIGTKTTDPLFHDVTKDVYEALFEIAHTIGEKGEDVGDVIGNESVQALHSKVYEAVESLKKELEGEINAGKLTVGQDNLYRGHVDKLECLCGNLSAFIKCDMEDKKEGEVEEINRGEAY